MPGYIHTCTDCGAHMQVHERYLGRNLRCTSCRSEFLAAIPDDVEVVEPLPEIRDEDLPQRERRRWKRWLLLLIPIAALIWWLGQDQSGGVGESLFKGGRTMGSMGTLNRDGNLPVYVAIDQEQAGLLEEVETTALGEEAFRTLISDGRCFEVAPGTSVRVLFSSDGGDELRVRILNGPWESRIGWVPADWLE